MAAIPPDEYADLARKSDGERILAEFPLPAGQEEATGKVVEGPRQSRRSVSRRPARLPHEGHRLVEAASLVATAGISASPLLATKLIHLQVGVPQRASPRPVRPVTTMLLALTTPSGNRSALPPCTRTLPQAELFHRAIVGRVAKGERVIARSSRAGTSKDAASAALPPPRTHPAGGPRRRRASRSPHHSRTDGTRRGGTACHSHSATHVDQRRRRRIATRRRRKRRSRRSFARCPPPLDQRIERLLGPPQGCSRVGERDARSFRPAFSSDEERTRCRDRSTPSWPLAVFLPRSRLLSCPATPAWRP